MTMHMLQCKTDLCEPFYDLVFWDGLIPRLDVLAESAIYLLCISILQS